MSGIPVAGVWEPSIPEGSIFFGGTDPGRFVISAFRVAEKGPEVFVVTQNNLALSYYADYLEDLYGGRIWVPARTNQTQALRQYVEEVKSGKRRDRGQLTEHEGHVRVEDTAGMMELNGILSEMIFQHNRDRHEFYVEESYCISWMTPYLGPHGLIMKLNPEPSALTEEVFARDTRFWAGCRERLLASEGFLENRPARRTFARLRASIAGLYAARGHLAEAEAAFKEAIELFPASPPVNFRLAQEVYLRLRRFEEARRLLMRYRTALVEWGWPTGKADKFIEHVDSLEKTSTRIAELEAETRTGKMRLRSAMELMELYHRTGRNGLLEKTARVVLNAPKLPSQSSLALAQLLEKGGKKGLMVEALDRCLESYPEDGPVDMLLEMARLYAGANRQ